MGTSMSISNNQRNRLFYENHSIPRKNIQINKRKKYQKYNGIYYTKGNIYSQNNQGKIQHSQAHTKKKTIQLKNSGKPLVNIIDKKQFDKYSRTQSEAKKSLLELNYLQHESEKIRQKQQEKVKQQNYSQQTDILQFLFPSEIKKQKKSGIKDNYNFTVEQQLAAVKQQFYSGEDKIIERSQSSKKAYNIDEIIQIQLTCSKNSDKQIKKRNYQQKLQQVLENNKKKRSRAKSLMISHQLKQIKRRQSLNSISEQKNNIVLKSNSRIYSKQPEIKLEADEQNTKNEIEQNKRYQNEKASNSMSNVLNTDQQVQLCCEQVKRSLNTDYYSGLTKIYVAPQFSQLCGVNVLQDEKSQSIQFATKKSKFLSTPTTNQYFYNSYSDNKQFSALTETSKYVPPKNLIYF